MIQILFIIIDTTVSFSKNFLIIKQFIVCGGLLS